MRSLLLLICCLPATTSARPADIDAALRLPQTWRNKVFRDVLEPVWLPGGSSFWYRIATAPGTFEYVLVDAETGRRTTAPDLRALGVAGETALRTSGLTIEHRRSLHTGVPLNLEIENQLDEPVHLSWINRQGLPVGYGQIEAHGRRTMGTFDGHAWLLKRADGATIAVLTATPAVERVVVDGAGLPPAPGPAEGPGALSPDGRWAAFTRSGRVMLRDTRTGATRHLATDLDATSPFQGPCVWSADGRSFLAQGAAPVRRRQIALVESSPAASIEPRLHMVDYPKPGDPLPRPVPVIFRPEEDRHDWTAVDPAFFPEPFAPGGTFAVRPSDDGKEFFLDYNQRGHQLYRIIAADARTGATRVVVEERSPTFIDYQAKTWRHWLDRTGELIWMSEREGWCHLWLVDARTGRVRNAITRGPWVVREVLAVDEQRREVWFMAGGVNPGEDPCHRHLCRAGFDGSGFTRLTQSDGDHRILFSPDRRFFIAVWSRADHPPVHELRRGADGALVCVLETADISRLLATGWTPPERFVAKGRDGTTDIHGVIIRPPGLDPARRHPVVEEIYAGPHDAFAPKEFSLLEGPQQLASLGFAVVVLDGMGTNHRGKAFHDVCWKNLKDAGFPDRIAWIRAAAATRPWMDLDRVGVYGTSAGGQNAMRALLDHGDFYRVAVASGGCHDNRMDKMWWNEQWLGWPVDESYARNSNVVDAHKLQGHLLLIVGELDRNVDPASTYQVVGALQRAGKSFDFMPVIGAGHDAGFTPAGLRLRLEFLLRHLAE
ncbi:MAG: prolyl oligopeptidase family serine peptidase [Kiritimatiellia bacterium]